jgi:hypothetical protein
MKNIEAKWNYIHTPGIKYPATFMHDVEKGTIIVHHPFPGQEVDVEFSVRVTNTNQAEKIKQINEVFEQQRLAVANAIMKRAESEQGFYKKWLESCCNESWNNIKITIQKTCHEINERSKERNNKPKPGKKPPIYKKPKKKLPPSKLIAGLVNRSK